MEQIRDMGVELHKQASIKTIMYMYMSGFGDEGGLVKETRKDGLHGG